MSEDKTTTLTKEQFLRATADVYRDEAFGKPEIPEGHTLADLACGRTRTCPSFASVRDYILYGKQPSEA